MNNTAMHDEVSETCEVRPARLVVGKGGGE